MGRQLSNYMRHDKLENYSVWIPERKRGKGPPRHRSTCSFTDKKKKKSVGMYSCHQKKKHTRCTSATETHNRRITKADKGYTCQWMKQVTNLPHSLAHVPFVVLLLWVSHVSWWFMFWTVVWWFSCPTGRNPLVNTCNLNSYQSSQPLAGHPSLFPVA